MGKRGGKGKKYRALLSKSRKSYYWLVICDKTQKICQRRKTNSNGVSVTYILKLSSGTRARPQVLKVPARKYIIYPQQFPSVLESEGT